METGNGTEPLGGTVKFYERHLVACTGPVTWPSEICQIDGFVGKLDTAISERLGELARAVKLTVCDAENIAGGNDLLVFPDMVRYKGLKEDDIETLLGDHLIGDQISTRLEQDALTGRYVFVCIHGDRDERCGECGPPLIEKLHEEVQAAGIARSVQILGTSHVSGHRFAGNVLIYPMGDWYGRVDVSDASRIVKEHLVGNMVLEDMWRGRMGLTQEEQLALLDSPDGVQPKS